MPVNTFIESKKNWTDNLDSTTPIQAPLDGGLTLRLKNSAQFRVESILHELNPAASWLATRAVKITLSRHINLWFLRCGQFDNKQIDISFSCVRPVIDNEFRHNIVKVVCGSTRVQSYFDNVYITKFIINNKTDAWKADVNLFTGS